LTLTAHRGTVGIPDGVKKSAAAKLGEDDLIPAPSANTLNKNHRGGLHDDEEALELLSYASHGSKLQQSPPARQTRVSVYEQWRTIERQRRVWGERSRRGRFVGLIPESIESHRRWHGVDSRSETQVLHWREKLDVLTEKPANSL
jgi:hypothetical protein